MLGGPPSSASGGSLPPVAQCLSSTPGPGRSQSHQQHPTPGPALPSDDTRPALLATSHALSPPSADQLIPHQERTKMVF